MSTVEPWIKENLEQWKSVFEACSRCPATSQIKGAALPSQYEIIKILNGLIGLLFPGCLGHDGGALFSDFGTGSNHCATRISSRRISQGSASMKSTRCSG